jgi:hypothetical protein
VHENFLTVGSKLKSFLPFTDNNHSAEASVDDNRHEYKVPNELIELGNLGVFVVNLHHDIINVTFLFFGASKGN